MNGTENNVVLMLGGNLGDTREYFSRAVQLISETVGVVEKTSGLYSSSPWGYPSQPDFLNRALIVKTWQNPFEVFDYTVKIEKLLGKNTLQQNGPRTIDIDILFYNDLIINDSSLQLPHPRLHLRRFNLMPLSEIIPDYIHPVLGEKISSLLEKCEDNLGVFKLTESF